jgi:hypothetical protein
VAVLQGPPQQRCWVWRLPQDHLLLLLLVVILILVHLLQQG